MHPETSLRMSKGTLKTIAAIVVVLLWLGLWAAGLWELVGNAVLWLGLAGFLWLAVAIVAEQVRGRRRFRQPVPSVIPVPTRSGIHQAGPKGPPFFAFFRPMKRNRLPTSIVA